ncbi:MAG: hypothetical protein H0T46_30520 [Deltaproteobacteria bacterium]|nr:hypothetical protein [Deltaproteobacteria bacterium]
MDVIGTAAAATFLRRAIRKAAQRRPELEAIEITKNRLDYDYLLPDDWKHGRTNLAALAELSCDLEELLLDLTGTVMVRRLRSIALLTDAGLFRTKDADHE